MPEELLPDKPLAIVGDEDVVMGFCALGFKIYPIRDPQDFKTTLDEIVQNKIGVCLVQDNIYQAGLSQIDNYKHLALPVFIPFSKTVETNLLDDMIKEIRLRATGAL